MKILVIEDHEEKLHDLVDCLQETLPGAQVSTAKSQHTGKEAALQGQYDFILLDMTMRNYERSVEEEGGRPHAFAGREILRQMRRHRIATPVIVVTQFDRFGEEEDFTTLADLKSELEEKFSNYVGTVHYRANVDAWRPALKEMIGLAMAPMEKSDD